MPKLPKIEEKAPETILALLRNQRPQGDYCFNFRLQHLPRRGTSTTYSGRLWGTRHESGPLNRIHLFDFQDSPTVITLLLQSGPHPRVWKLDPNGEPRELRNADMFTPLLPQVLYTPFHLLMPFIYWDDWEALPPKRIKGRPARQFLMLPPKNYAHIAPKLKAVRMALDAQFNALLRADMLDVSDKPLFSFKVLTFKKVQELWIPRSIDLVSSLTRDKTRFKVWAAALNLDLPTEAFTPEGLKHAPPLIPRESFDYFP